MPELYIGSVPDDLLEQLRRRAEQNYRSLQGELLAIIEAAVREERPATPCDILEEVRRLGLETPDEAAAIIRADREPLTPA
jgi:antitoxin FitA